MIIGTFRFKITSRTHILIHIVEQLYINKVVPV